MSFEPDVIIVGAGAAGLSAARLLAQHRLRCLILEGSELIGGRLRTVRRAGWDLPIELGAEFVHGRPSPTLALAGGSIELSKVVERRVLVGPKPELMEDTWQRFAEALEPALRAPERQSVAEFLQQSPLAADHQHLVRMLVEGYHAASLDDVSARVVAEDAAKSKAGFEQFRTAHGYDQVLSSLEHGLRGDAVRLELGRRVTRIAWSKDHVIVEASGRDGEARLHAKRCLVTVSVGVLQQPEGEGGISFDPAPPAFRAALDGIGMGSVLRVVLRFIRAPWVPAPPGLEPVFAHLSDAPFATLWREVRDSQTQVTAWSGGPAVRELLQLEPRQIVDAALSSLARASGVSLIELQRALLEAHYHDFNRDPFTRGAYSYVRPGGSHAAAALAQPWENTVHFAGEALDLQYPGTVAGALGSGEHVARRMIATWAR